MISNRNRRIVAVLLAGLVVSILIAAGTTTNYVLSGGKNPVRLLNFVASGMFGRTAFQASGQAATMMAVLGAVFHIMVSLIWSTLFFAASSRIGLLMKDWRLVGLGYGLLIWSTMAFLVMPMSHAPDAPVKVPDAFVDIIIIILGAGLPISYLAHRHKTRSSHNA